MYFTPNENERSKHENWTDGYYVTYHEMALCAFSSMSSTRPIVLVETQFSIQSTNSCLQRPFFTNDHLSKSSEQL